MLVRLGDSEHLADDDDRQGIGEAFHQIAFAVGLEGIDQAMGQVAHARAHRLGAAGVEGLGHEAADALVVRRVHEKDGVAEGGR